jgi:sugar-specific transcriptional regulator TrmB
MSRSQHLVDLGYTALESDIYLLLLQEGPLTGYRVAKNLGKPAANTYKALESLVHKGAVTLDDSESRVYSPVPAEEFLRQLDRVHASRRERAREALANLEPHRGDDRIYRLSSREQIAERCRSIVERSEFAVLIDGDAGFLADLTPAIEEAAERGVQVLIKAYEPLEIAGARVIERIRPEEITGGVPGDSFVLDADGREYLLARLEDDGTVHHAIWTQAVTLAYQGYQGLISELTLTSMMNHLRTETTVEELREVFDRDRPLHPVSSRNPVFEGLLEGLGYQLDSSELEGS